MITSAAGSTSFWQEQDPHDDEQEQHASKI